MTNALEIRNLKKSFGNLEVIKDLSLTAKRGRSNMHYWNKWIRKEYPITVR